MEKIKKRVVSWLCAALCFCMLVGMLPVTVQAKKYYSVKSLGLDYGRGYDSLPGDGKKGFKYIEVLSVSGNKVKYKYARIRFYGGDGLPWPVPYGKTRTAKITKATKHYGYDMFHKRFWKAYDISLKYGHLSNQFKKTKFLFKTSSKLGKKSVGYAKIKNGKITMFIDSFDFIGFS